MDGHVGYIYIPVYIYTCYVLQVKLIKKNEMAVNEGVIFNTCKKDYVELEHLKKSNFHMYLVALHFDVFFYCHQFGVKYCMSDTIWIIQTIINTI